MKLYITKTRNKGRGNKEALKRKRFKEKSIKKILEIYQEKMKTNEEVSYQPM
jgi:hypothetical protein